MGYTSKQQASQAGNYSAGSSAPSYGPARAPAYVTDPSFHMRYLPKVYKNYSEINNSYFGEE
jgi:hypothetical protein